MTSFAALARGWPREQAEAFVAAWRARAPQRSAWFVGMVAGPPAHVRSRRRAEVLALLRDLAA